MFLSPWKVYEPQPKLSIWRQAKESIYPHNDLILGETATAGSGGCAGLSNTFVAGFWWTHTLGEMGLLRYKAVFRQDFVGWSGKTTPSQYTLAGPPGWCGASEEEQHLTPNPDYFTSLLWMQLVGPVVLNITLGGYPAALSVHANCAVSRGGAVVLSYSNLAEEALVLPGLITGVSATTPRSEYVLTSGEEGNMQSPWILLNGQGPLTAQAPLLGSRVENIAAVTLPARSYGFIVLENAGATACM